ncbi:hypothetical protein [Streptomyces sp. NPDC087294]|uniref:hypothetical protein n=1 Tax=Streptomyces sp. NPDC087294 TaxID=3365777 RepID=UPI0037F95294
MTLPEPSRYWAEVHAEGPVYGTGENVRCVLATFQAVSPVLMLRWLSGMALRIAELIDPDPARTPWLSPAVYTLCDAGPASPSALRTWATDPAGLNDAHEHIKGADPLVIRFADADCTYTFSVWPIRWESPPEPECAPPMRHRTGGLSHPLHVPAPAPWT